MFTLSFYRFLGSSILEFIHVTLDSIDFLKQFIDAIGVLLHI